MVAERHAHLGGDRTRLGRREHHLVCNRDGERPQAPPAQRILAVTRLKERATRPTHRGGTGHQPEDPPALPHRLLRPGPSRMREPRDAGVGLGHAPAGDERKLGRLRLAEDPAFLPSAPLGGHQKIVGCLAQPSAKDPAKTGAGLLEAEYQVIPPLLQREAQPLTRVGITLL